MCCAVPPPRKRKSDELNYLRILLRRLVTFERKLLWHLIHIQIFNARIIAGGMCLTKIGKWNEMGTSSGALRRNERRK